MTALLTVLIPTYNRPEQLVRTIRFLQRHPAPFPIIIADGSDAEQARHNRQCRELGNNILYFHVPLEPPEDTWKNYFRRIEKALDQISTPYAAFCADDDLLVPASAIESAAFLQDNPQYVACHGHYLQFEYTADVIRIPNFEYQGPSIDADEIGGRSIQLFSRYEAPFYAVYRTAAMRLLMERCQEPAPPLWPEIYHTTAAAVAGKIHRSDTIYCLRNITVPPHHAQASAFASFGQWVASDFDDFLTHYVKYRAQVLEWAGPEADPQTLRHVLDMAFITYLGSEFNLSTWIDRCCETAKDDNARDKLRARLNQNLRRAVDRAAVPSLRGACRDLVQALRNRRDRDSWTSICKSEPNRFYGVDVKTTLVKRFSHEQWDLLRRIDSRG